MCGFANAQGGSIYIGCDDDGNVVGLDNSRKLLEDIPNKIRNTMSIVVDVNLLEKDNKEYIEIKVPPYPVAISCKGIYYYRSGSTMQTLSGPELESFILRKRGASWDNMPLPGFTINDIDDDLVENFKKLAIMKLLTSSPNMTYDDIAQKIGIGRATVARTIKELKDDNLIKRISTDKKGYWEIIQR